MSSWPMTPMAVVSTSSARAAWVGGLLSRGRPVQTRDVADIGRFYFIVPLFVLSGLGLFDVPGIDIQHFDNDDAALSWGERDIARRRQAQRGAKCLS